MATCFSSTPGGQAAGATIYGFGVWPGPTTPRSPRRWSGCASPPRRAAPASEDGCGLRLATYVKLAFEAALVVGAWSTVLLDADYRDWGGVVGAAAFTGLGLLGLTMDLGALPEERLRVVEQARAALNVRSIRSRPSP